jgi:hypothetical protein
MCEENPSESKNAAKIRQPGCGGALSSGGAILCENKENGRSAVATQIERQGHWNPSAARKDPTGPGLGVHKEGTEASTAREKNSSRGKNPTSRSDQLFGPRSKPRTHKRNSQIWFQHEQDANSKYLIEN